jgi:NAD(P)-dependent dehydrogenase (short-subunit alcohol dehydrogenase family)
MQRLAGRVAIVTGAAHGPKASIGVTFAKALAAEGASVVVAARRDCSDVAAEIKAAGGNALALHVDVKEEPSIQEMVARTVEKFGRLDILVTNAAVGSNIPPIPLEKMAVEEWDELMRVNVRGPFLCAKAAAPVMRAQKYGKIINIGSTTMIEGLTERLHYVTAKGAILAMTRALARELGPDGIRVNTIAFGLIMSPAVEAAMKGRPGLHEHVLAARSIPADTYPADLAGTLVYLASADSDSVTGQFVIVDNGAMFG